MVIPDTSWLGRDANIPRPWANGFIVGNRDRSSRPLRGSDHSGRNDLRTGH